MLNKFVQVLKNFGFLRLSLFVLVVIDMVLRPPPGTTPDYQSTYSILLMIFSALAPILFMLLLLDAIMTMVYMSSMESERKPTYRFILIANLLMALIFFLYWVPYFRPLV